MIEVVNWRTEILSILEQIKDTGANADILKKLFIERLNFEPAEQEVSPEILDKFPKEVKDKIKKRRNIDYFISVEILNVFLKITKFGWK